LIQASWLSLNRSLAAVKAAIKRAKSRKRWSSECRSKLACILPSDRVRVTQIAFELFRAEAGSNALDLWLLATEGAQEVQFKTTTIMEATTVRKVVEVNDTPVRATNGRPLIRRVEKILMPNGGYRYPVTYIDMTPGYVDTTDFWNDQKRAPGYELQIEP
jgi:hypothetical protein